MVTVACGPPQPPKEANIPDPPDPTTENPADIKATSGSVVKPSSDSSGIGNGFSPTSAGAPKAGETLSVFLESVKWGTSHADLTRQFTQTGGVIWKDYDEKLAKTRVGPEQIAMEAERESAKTAFARSFVEFKDTPTGYDTTAIRGEYTYKNKESLMWIQRQGKKRYFFFINDKLWKMYDEIPLSDSGTVGKNYLDAVNTLNAQIGTPGQVHNANPAKGIPSTFAEWRDSTSHLRLVDRSRDQVVGLVIEDLGTLSNLAALRPNKLSDPTEIDPSIAAVTNGANRSDPNAPSAAPSASASSGKKGSPPKKKK